MHNMAQRPEAARINMAQRPKAARTNMPQRPEAARIKLYRRFHGYDYSRKKGHADDELSPWYNKKNFWMMHREPFNEKLFSHDFVTLCADDLSALMPFYRYFLRVYGYGA